jgi:hypothetical protein
MAEHLSMFHSVFQAGGVLYRRPDGLTISAQFHLHPHTREIVTFHILDSVPVRELATISAALGLPDNFQPNGAKLCRQDGMTVIAQHQQEAGPEPTLFFMLDHVPAADSGRLCNALGLPMYPEWQPINDKEDLQQYFPWMRRYW